MNKERLAYLFRAYVDKTATAAEREEFMELVQVSENDEFIKQLLSETWAQHPRNEQTFSAATSNEMLQNILAQGRKARPARPVKRMYKLAAAAAVLLMMLAAGYLLLNKDKQVTETAKLTTPSADPIVPGRNQAVLTLANGTNILLDSTQRGTLTQQGSTKVINLGEAVLTYDATAGEARENLYNVLATPRGGQYRVVLTDGTKVWLNASSSIRFPVAFTGNERHVTITGEAYFEVAKNAAKPFLVTAGDATIRVLGTHFNIMAYDDENATTTTLLEGAVRVSRGEQAQTLTPGRQTKMYHDGRMKSGEADIEETMAWKNGWFQFSSWPIDKIMRHIARWYDVEVSYEGNIPKGTFSGFVSRANEISEALRVMQTGGVKFKIEGHKITVSE